MEDVFERAIRFLRAMRARIDEIEMFMREYERLTRRTDSLSKLIDMLFTDEKLLTEALRRGIGYGHITNIKVSIEDDKPPKIEGYRVVITPEGQKVERIGEVKARPARRELVDIHQDKDTVTITAEIPSEVDTKNIEASYRNGVLEIRLKKKVLSTKPAYAN